MKSHKMLLFFSFAMLSIATFVNIAANPDKTISMTFAPQGGIALTENINLNSPYVTPENRAAVRLGIEHLNHSIVTKCGYGPYPGRQSTPINLHTLEDALIKGRGLTWLDFEHDTQDMDNKIFNLRHELKIYAPKTATHETIVLVDDPVTPAKPARQLIGESSILKIDLSKNALISSKYATEQNQQAILAGIAHMNNTLAQTYWQNGKGEPGEQEEIVAIDSADLKPLADAIIEAHRQATEKFERSMAKKETELAWLQQEEKKRQRTWTKPSTPTTTTISSMFTAAERRRKWQIRQSALLEEITKLPKW